MTTLLLVLACPVSMGVMMWLMMRGGRQASTATPERVEQRRRIAALERELAELRGTREAATTPISRSRSATPPARSSTYRSERRY